MEIALYGVIGALAGFSAGLLGIGGGLIVGPTLIWLFTAHGVAKDVVVPLAIGTSLATVIFSSSSSVRAHSRRNAINWSVVRSMSPGMIVGALAGAAVVTSLPGHAVKIVVAILLAVSATQMLLKFQPGPEQAQPGGARLMAVGTGVGLFGGMAGLGGSSLAVPFMVWWRERMAVAVGTASALSLVTSAAGTIVYASRGLGVSSSLPSFSLSYIYLPALIGIAGTSVLTAPLGARVAHALPMPRLKLVFALALYAIALRIALM